MSDPAQERRQRDVAATAGPAEPEPAPATDPSAAISDEIEDAASYGL